MGLDHKLIRCTQYPNYQKYNGYEYNKLPHDMERAIIEQFNPLFVPSTAKKISVIYEKIDFISIGLDHGITFPVSRYYISYLSSEECNIIYTSNSNKNIVVQIDPSQIKEYVYKVIVDCYVWHEEDLWTWRKQYQIQDYMDQKYGIENCAYYLVDGDDIYQMCNLIDPTWPGYGSLFEQNGNQYTANEEELLDNIYYWSWW